MYHGECETEAGIGKIRCRRAGQISRADFLRIMNRPVRYISRDALEGRVDVSRIMLRYGQSNLYLVTNNTPSSAETVLASGALSRLIDACREWADLIILDTAPMAQVSDTEDIARLADASLLVVREDTVLAPHINDAIDALNRTEGKVIGCVLNYASRGLAETAGSYGYGGYYGKGAK